MEVCHWDGTRDNDRLENLRWASRADNAADMVRHGRSGVGERHPNATLSNSEVATIRTLGPYLLQREIAALYAVSEPTISAILNCKSRTKEVAEAVS
ncbi:hypothetical protein LCGC14_2176430 [marine sediment metagenome]|uniref:HNH nuclease domain-containing protein n=1 Tax=marine sediment metagenome TaxID=412755 RepID=A0A0F9DNM2_9ZZZZ